MVRDEMGEGKCDLGRDKAQEGVVRGEMGSKEVWSGVRWGVRRCGQGRDGE